MKKKIALLLSMILVFAMMLGACGTDPKTVDYNGSSYDELKTEMLNYIYNVQALPTSLQSLGLTMEDLEDERTMKELVANGAPQALLSAGLKYQAVIDEYGECVNFDTTKMEVSEDGSTSLDPEDIGFEISKAGKTLTTNVRIVCQKDDVERKVDFQVVYNYNTMEVTGITVEPVLSMGEKMSMAALNTVISICIVFCVLILISLIIYCFNIFPYMEKKKKEKAAAATAIQDQVVSQIEQREQIAASVSQPVTDDTELIAVIAAAIASAEGTSTSDFVVRSINRR